MQKDKIKKIISDSVRVVAFSLVFVLILTFLSNSVFSGANVAKHSERLADSYAFKRDPEQTTDVVFLGNSDAYSAFNPIEMWRNNGITSTVCASAYQNLVECQKALEAMLQTQSPKLVVLEVDLLYYKKEMETDKAKNNSKLAYFFDNTVKPDDFENYITGQISMFTYHNVWKDLEKDERGKFTHGYRCYLKKTTVEPEQYMIETDDTETPTENNLSLLSDFMCFCKKNNLPVLFTEVLTMTSWSTPRHNGIQKLADKYGVDFIDYNLLYDELGVNMAYAFRDNGNHVNYATACKITDYMGDYIKENYGIEDHRNDAVYADYWNEELKCFDETYLKKS